MEEVELDDNGHHFRFYTKAFGEDQTKEFLSHYAGVLGDALNPSMSHYWKTSIFTERGKKIQVEREGLLVALSRIVGLTLKNGVDVRPFLWLERYVKGNVDRDPAVLVQARYSFQELCLREFGEAGEGWREWDEQSRAARLTMNKVDDLFERLLEFAPSLPALWEVAPESQMDTFALRDAFELVEESRQSWLAVSGEFPSAIKDVLLEFILRVKGHLRRLSSGRFRGSNCDLPSDISQLANDLLAKTTELAFIYGTDLPELERATLNDEQTESGQTDQARSGWLRVKDAATAAGVAPFQISRAATNGELTAVGNRNQRRICPESLSKWQLGRAQAPLRQESDAAVRRMLSRADDH